MSRIYLSFVLVYLGLHLFFLSSFIIQPLYMEECFLIFLTFFSLGSSRQQKTSCFEESHIGKDTLDFDSIYHDIIIDSVLLRDFFTWIYKRCPIPGFHWNLFGDLFLHLDLGEKKDGDILLEIHFRDLYHLDPLLYGIMDRLGYGLLE